MPETNIANSIDFLLFVAAQDASFADLRDPGDAAYAQPAEVRNLQINESAVTVERNSRDNASYVKRVAGRRDGSVDFSLLFSHKTDAGYQKIIDALNNKETVNILITPGSTHDAEEWYFYGEFWVTGNNRNLGGGDDAVPEAAVTLVSEGQWVEGYKT